MDKLDVFLDNLQNEIFEEARQALGEKGFHRWRNPKFCGRMENPDGYGRVTGECGDTMEIFLKFKDNRISHASYVTNGCASSSISGSFAAELTLGKIRMNSPTLQIKKSWKLSADYLKKTGTVPALLQGLSRKHSTIT